MNSYWKGFIPYEKLDKMERNIKEKIPKKRNLKKEYLEFAIKYGYKKAFMNIDSLIKKGINVIPKSMWAIDAIKYETFEEFINSKDFLTTILIGILDKQGNTDYEESYFEYRLDKLKEEQEKAIKENKIEEFIEKLKLKLNN